MSALHYENNEKENIPLEFTNLSFGNVFYGRGWPTTFNFTIPDAYDMPAVGYVDIELNLTNLEPNDANITESGGKYYYRASSKGAHTINLKTDGSQTAAVGVELIHRDFLSTTGSTDSRSYLTIASGKITNTAPENGTYKNNNNTVNICIDETCENIISSYRTNQAWGTNTNSQSNNSAASFSPNSVDATKLLYLKMHSNYTGHDYWATITAEELYNNGGNSTVTFSTNPPNIKDVTIITTNSYYSTTILSHTEDGVTVAFSELDQVQNNRVDMVQNSTVSISIPVGYHLKTVKFNYYSLVYTYDPGSTTIVSGGGSYSSSNNTWTAANNSTTSVTLRMYGHDPSITCWFERLVAITDIVVTIERN